MNTLKLTNQELSILHRAIKVYNIDLSLNNLHSSLDYPDALESVKIKIKNTYENN